MPGSLSGGLTVLICGEANILSASIRKCATCAHLPILFGGVAQKLYKITVSKGGKEAKAMLNVSAMFFITCGVS